MFCEKCGTKNKDGAKFCEKCGNKLETPTKTKIEKKENNSENKVNVALEKIKNLPKKTKIIMAAVIIVLIIAIITLSILLNNPIKKVEDALASYYTNYSEKNNEELVEIGKILKSNKEDKKVLNNIKETASNIINKWSKNFNTDYKNEEELTDAYKKVSGAIKGIYKYYNGLEYMLDYEAYQKLNEELNELYYSKSYYLKGLEYEADDNEYYAYYNYQKVIEKDSYYKKAQKFISDYVKEEMDNYKKDVEALITTDENSTNEEILNNYLEQVKYMNNKKYVNNIDLSTTEEYQKLYKNASNKVLEYAKKVITELEKEEDYNNIVKLIENALKSFNKDSDVYKELNKLLKTYENKLPDSLLDQYRVSYDGARYSKYSKTIDGKEYANHLSFSFEGETQSIVYRLNGDYKKLRTTIVRGEDWDKSFTGYFVISGDGKELYKSDAITKSSELKAEINLDVTKVDDLKIEFVTTSEAKGWDSFYIYLVEPYLYK